MLIKPYIELEQLMQRNGYNQKELAAAMARKMGTFSAATLSNRINGKTPFLVSEAVVISEILNIPPNEVYGYFIKPWAIQARKKQKKSAKADKLVSFGA